MNRVSTRIKAPLLQTLRMEHSRRNRAATVGIQVLDFKCYGQMHPHG